MLFLFYGRAPSGRAFRFKSSFLWAFLFNPSRIFSFIISFFFFNIVQQPQKKTQKRAAKLAFVVRSARVIQALLRRALALPPSSLLFMCFLFFRFFFWVCCCFARGLSLLPGGWFRGLLVCFFCLLWWLLLLLLFCLRALFVSSLGLVRLGSVVLVRLFLPRPFGLRWLLPFLRVRLCPVVVSLVFAPSLVPRFLRFLFFRLRLLASVVVRLPLVPLRWFVRWLLALVPFGFLSLVARAPLGWFLPLFLPVVSVVWVRVRGLPSPSLVVWGFLPCCSCLLAFALLLVGVFSRWVRGGFFALSSL